MIPKRYPVLLHCSYSFFDSCLNKKNTLPWITALFLSNVYIYTHTHLSWMQSLDSLPMEQGFHWSFATVSKQTDKLIGKKSGFKLHKTKAARKHRLGSFLWRKSYKWKIKCEFSRAKSNCSQVQVNSKKGGFAIIFLQFTHFLQLMDYNSAQMVILDQGSEEMWTD